MIMDENRNQSSNGGHSDSDNDKDSVPSSSIGTKRKRTESQNASFVPASPPKYVSFDEVMNAANNLRDMSLLHQIVDNDFKIEDNSNNDGLQNKVKDVVKQAFWDIVRENFSKDPPDYTQGFVLLEDIKQALFFSLILPQHTKLREEIKDKLDPDLIRQQAENNSLDIQHYAQYVISVMAKLCSPARDEKINQLSQLTDIVDIFRGILETLDLMKIDMANFIIGVTKPEILTQSIEWERKKFAEVLAVQPDSLHFTTMWLSRHIGKKKADISQNTSTSVVIDAARVRQLVPDIMSDAYLDLLEWRDDRFDEYPETLVFDREKLWDLKLRFKKISMCGTILLLVSNVVNFDSKVLIDFKEKLKSEIGVLLESSKTNDEINAVVKDIADYVITELKKKLSDLEMKPMTDELLTVLKNQIIEITDEDHKIRILVARRLREFFLQILTSLSTTPQKVPIGLSAMQKEISEVAGIFLRIVSRNRNVYVEYYFDIVEQNINV